MSEPRLFLVRVWRHLGQFRAAVRGLDQGEPLLFEEPAQLGEYLCQASVDEPQPPDSGFSAAAARVPPRPPP